MSGLIATAKPYRIKAAHRRRWKCTSALRVYQHTDALGSPVAVTDQNRNIERMAYEPFGAVIGGAAKDGPGYTGHVFDAATGLTYAQQRYFDSSIGRFLSVDPVSADPNTGAMFNRYVYALNNPYRFTDPDGRQAKSGGTSGVQCDAACMQKQRDEQEEAQRAAREESSSERLVNALRANDKGDWRTALHEGLAMVSSSWREAFSNPGNSVLTIMSIVPFVGIEASTAKGAASGFRGSRGFELSNAPYQAVRNLPTTIGGRPYSGHALDQMQNRGYMPSVVENTIHTGTGFPTRTGTAGYFDMTNNVRVITDASTGRVVTVIPGRP